MLTTTEEKLKEEFEGDKPNSVERVKKLKDYAFIHFRERDDAINALRRLNGKIKFLFYILLTKQFNLKNFNRCRN